MASDSPIVIEFYYDLISPYCYFAFEVLKRYKSKWNISIKLKPVFLMDLLKLSKNSVTLSENKKAYIGLDVRRIQNQYQLPLNIPQNLMDLLLKDYSITAQKFITAVDMVNSDFTEKITAVLWSYIFQVRKDIHAIEILKEAAESINMNVKDVDNAMQLIDDPETKERLDGYTKQACDCGGFGVPTIIAHINGKTEMFFGFRLEQLAYILDKEWEGPHPSPQQRCDI